VAISAILHQKIGEDLAPITYASRLLSPAQQRYAIYEKECLAVVFGCEKYRVYLEHKEFTLHTDNQAVSWMLKHVKEMGRVGLWILRFSFKFKVFHIPGKTNVVADCLTRQYEDVTNENFLGLILQHLPAAFQSVREHQKKDQFCRDLYQKVVTRTRMCI
jgi:hypothetical protein